MRSEDSLYDIENNLNNSNNLSEKLNPYDDEDNLFSENFTYILRLAKSIKYYTLSDVIINLLWVFISPWYVFPPIFSLIGYVGYLNFNTNCLYTYLIFLMLYIAFKITYLIYCSTDNINYSNEIIIFGVILGVVSTFSNLYICRLIYILIKNIEGLNDSQKTQLINAKHTKRDFVFW